jgi:hypothetical protein
MNMEFYIEGYIHPFIQISLVFMTFHAIQYIFWYVNNTYAHCIAIL